MTFQLEAVESSSWWQLEAVWYERMQVSIQQHWHCRKDRHVKQNLVGLLIFRDASIPAEPFDPALHHYIEAVHAFAASFAYSARLVVSYHEGAYPLPQPAAFKQTLG